MRRTQRIGIIAVALLAAITVAVFLGLQRKPFEGGKRTVTADFQRAPQLHSGDEVRLEGNIEGKVTSVALAPDGSFARVEMAVDKSAGPVYDNAHARLRELTLLGGRFYVEIERGTKDAGDLGTHVIPETRTSVQVEVEDLTDVTRLGAFTGLQTLPAQVGKAFGDPSAPSNAIQTADGAADDLAAATKAARGLLPGSDLPKVIVEGAKVTGTLTYGNDDLQRLVSGAAGTLQTTGARNAEIQQTLAASPSVAFDLDNTLGRLDHTLDLTNGLVVRLERGAPSVAPALRALQPALRGLDVLAPKLPFLFDRVGFGLEGLRRSQGAANFLHPFRPTLNNLVQNVKDLNKVDPITEKPTSVMIGGTAAGFGGVANLQDAAGHYVRFPASVGASSVYLPCQSNVVAPDAPSALACDDATQVLQSYLGYVPGGSNLVSSLSGGAAGKKGGTK